MNLGTRGAGVFRKVWCIKTWPPPKIMTYGKCTPPPPCACHPCHMHKVCRLLSSPILLRQKFTNLKSYSQSCSRSSLCFGFLGRVLWQGFLVQQRSTTTVPLSNLPTSCRYPFPTPGQALGICRHTEFCKTDRTTWKLTYYARRQHETERTKNRGFWFFRCRVDVLHS